MRRLADREEGASLVLALVFLTVFGLFVPVLLASVETHLKVNTVVEAAEAKLYGADGGIEYAIQKLRTDATLCADAAAGPQSLPSITVNGRTVTVQCESTEGNAVKGPDVTDGYAVITSDPSQDPSFSIGKGKAISVEGGDIFSAGKLDLKEDLTLTGGDFLQKNPACPGSPPLTQNSRLTVVAPNTWSCTTNAVPDPAVDLPATIPPAALGDRTVMGLSGDDCQIFYPGTYTTKPDIDEDDVYFASGIYYFTYSGEWKTEDREIVAGAPSPGEADDPTVGSPACATDAMANAEPGRAGLATGTGVEWIFGGSARVHLDDKDSVLEMFSRCELVVAAVCTKPGSPVEGTDGVSVYSVRAQCPTPTVPPCTTGPWTVWSSPGKDVFKMDQSADAVLHGTLYAWNSPITFHSKGSSVRLLGGLTAKSLDLRAKAKRGSGPLEITVPGAPPSTRTVRVTATAQGTSPGEASTVIRAMVQIIPAGVGTYDASVQSWRKI